MNEQSGNKPHLVGWTLLLLAVPVIYVLTMPFMIWAGTRQGHAHSYVEPSWVGPYTAPYDEWILKIPVLGETCDAYYEWWARRLY